MGAGVSRWIARVAIAGAVAAFACAAAAQDDDVICQMSSKDLPRGAPRFEDYPAAVETIITPAKPVITKGERMFRTQLRRGASAGPVFAGRYAMATWGCGTSCFMWSLIDSKTGEVTAAWDAVEVNIDWVDPDGLYGPIVRKDSRLLILIGTLKEDVKRTGFYYYLMDKGRLKLIRSYPYTAYCKAKGFAPLGYGAWGRPAKAKP